MNKGFPAGVLALDRLASAPVEWSGLLTADRSVWDLGDVALTAPPEIELRAEGNADGGVRVRGILVAPVELQCSRCLEPIQERFEVEIDLRFDPAIGPADETVGLYPLEPDADELELLPALREELLLTLPVYPVCAVGCRGLCAGCGANRNREECGCRTDAIDPRWEALRQRFPHEPDAADGAGSGTDDG